MKETTIIINAQLTFVRQHEDDVTFVLDKYAIAEALKENILDADDVLVLSAKAFEAEGAKDD